MTNDDLDAIEAQVRAGGFTSIEANRNLIALVAEVRRLRALHCVREVIGEPEVMCHKHGWVP